MSGFVCFVFVVALTWTWIRQLLQIQACSIHSGVCRFTLRMSVSITHMTNVNWHNGARRGCWKLDGHQCWSCLKFNPVLMTSGLVSHKECEVRRWGIFSTNSALVLHVLFIKYPINVNLSWWTFWLAFGNCRPVHKHKRKHKYSQLEGNTPIIVYCHGRPCEELLNNMWIPSLSHYFQSAHELFVYRDILLIVHVNILQPPNKLVEK